MKQVLGIYSTRCGRRKGTTAMDALESGGRNHEARCVMRVVRRRRVAAPRNGLALGCGERCSRFAPVSDAFFFRCFFEQLEYRYLLKSCKTRSAIFGWIDVRR